MELGEFMREKGVVRYVVVNEVWMTVISKAEILMGDPLIQPSKHPDRIDTLLIEAHDTINTHFRVFRIDRTGRKPKLVSLPDITEDQAAPGGTYDGLLTPPGTIH